MIRRLRSTLLIGLLAAACAGPAGGAGHRVIVRLYDAHDGVRLELANASHPELHDVYSEQRTDAALKLAPDELMDELVASLEQVAQGQLAEDEDLPTVETTGALGLRGWVVVKADGETRSFEVPAQAPTAAQLGAYVRMKLIINEYYSKVSGLQYIQNPKGHHVFEPRP